MFNKRKAKSLNNVIPKTVFGFLIHICQEYKLLVFIYLALAFIAGFWGPFNSLLVGNIINMLPTITNGDVSSLFLPSILIVVNFLVFDNLTWRMIDHILSRILPDILIRIDQTLLNYILQQSNQFFQENMIGDLYRQILQVISSVESFITSSLPNVIRMFSLLLVSFITVYRVNFIFCLILVSFSIAFFMISMKMSEHLVHLTQIKAQKEKILGGQIVDSLTNQMTIKLFGRFDIEAKYKTNAFREYKIASQKQATYSILIHSIQGGLIAIMFGVSLFVLLYLYGQSRISIGDFALVIGLCIEIGYMFWITMSTHFHKMQQSIATASVSLANLLVPLGIKDKAAAEVMECTKGEIVFDKVSFSYGGNALIFHKKSVTIRPGQKVGLVGSSGGGKTTFINLILRLYDVTEGSILIDGQDVRDVTQYSLRQNISMIPQDPLLFNRSVFENIRYGTTATKEEVILAAQKANAHDFIMKLEDSYDTMAGERGMRLSGGQRQRIAIARAALKNAPILILDEATSQLDSVTEHSIQESLSGIMKNKTTLVIAHRLSTLLDMDRILVFDKGQIVQDGSHAELLAKPGLYETLWDTQVGGFLVDDMHV